MRGGGEESKGEDQAVFWGGMQSLRVPAEGCQRRGGMRGG